MRRSLAALVLIPLLSVACGFSGRPQEPADVLGPATVTPTATHTAAPNQPSLPTAEPTATPNALPSPTPEATTTPTSSPEMTSTPTAGPTTTLEIINDSGMEIWFLYLSPDDRDQRADDEYLGEAIIAPGDSLTLTGIPHGSYNVLVEGDLYNDIETWDGVPFNGLVTWRVTGKEDEIVPLTIINSSPVEMEYVYARPIHGNGWGDSLLTDNEIRPGDSYTLIGIERGTYDVKAEGTDHTIIGTWFDAQFYEAYGPKTWMVAGSGESASLSIVNSSGADIGHVILAPSYSDRWGDNLLGDHIIGPGESFALTGIPFGTYDMRAETPGHVEIDARFEQTLDGPRTWEVAGRSGEFLPRVDQWAFAATASSERASPDWSAQQATGEPDTPGCGDHASAWASAAPDGVDHLETRFRQPVLPRRINIHETHSPGFIVRVEVVDEAGQYYPVWEGEATPAGTCPRLFSFLVTEIDVPVVGVRIHLDQRDGGNWNQIDAVELVGLEPQL